MMLSRLEHAVIGYWHYINLQLPLQTMCGNVSLVICCVCIDVLE